MAGVVLDQAYLSISRFGSSFSCLCVSLFVGWLVGGQRLNRWTPKHLESGSTLRHPSMMHVTNSN